ncbi:MAG: Hpt domain-containing protein [Candidatus Cloacimonetes bacterium]|nr:Hpt domain-containing protein [Candidatus Cloacimonadota bacterium]
MKELPDYISRGQIDNIISSVGEEIADTLLEEVFQIFSEDSRTSIEKFNQFFDQGDLMAFQKTAHHLKGAAINLGLDEVGSICMQFENYTGELPSSEIRVVLDDLINKLRVLNEWISTAF